MFQQVCSQGMEALEYKASSHNSQCCLRQWQRCQRVQAGQLQCRRAQPGQRARQRQQRWRPAGTQSQQLTGCRGCRCRNKKGHESVICSERGIGHAKYVLAPHALRMQHGTCCMSLVTVYHLMLKAWIYNVVIKIALVPMHAHVVHAYNTYSLAMI